MSGFSNSSAVDNTHNEFNVIQQSVKNKLKMRIFLGRYLERRLVSKTIGYRDVVLLSAAETELKHDLEVIQTKLLNTFPTVWLGITDANLISKNSGICLWTEINGEPFGPFWFQIKSVYFRENEISVQLKCLRYISEKFIEIEPILSSNSFISGVKDANNSFACDSVTENYLSTIKAAISVNSLKNFIKFLFVLVIAIVTGLTSLIDFLGNFILSMTKEASNLIKHSTPLLLGFLDFISKIVGGFYLLMAMIFRQTQAPVPPRSGINRYKQTKNQLEYNHLSFD